MLPVVHSHPWPRRCQLHESVHVQCSQDDKSTRFTGMHIYCTWSVALVWLEGAAGRTESGVYPQLVRVDETEALQ